MHNQFEYTTLAHRYTARFPKLTYLGTQINFWIIANLLLVTIIYLHSKILSESVGSQSGWSIYNGVILAITFGIVYGVCLGNAEFYLERRLFRQVSLGKAILVKAIVGISLIGLLLLLLQFMITKLFPLSPAFPSGIEMNEKSWDFLAALLLIYYFFMTLIVNFINQVNKKYGPGVLLPLLLGKYSKPKEEDRIFMFMDLKSSTTTAEKLGHLKYSAFIKDCFADINEVIYPFRAQIYQYVGDEIVLMWPEREGVLNSNCINFFFACLHQFGVRSDYYLNKYGLVPQFKAGAHCGTVTAVEIGEVKKDIAYHGDTLNTAARIQGVCNEYEKDLLVSKYLLNKINSLGHLNANSIGMIALRGKMELVEIYSIEALP